MATLVYADGLAPVSSVLNVVKLPGLFRRRLEATLTQQQLADKAKLQRVTVTRLEKGGEALPSTVRKLADALGCTARELMTPE